MTALKNFNVFDYQEFLHPTVHFFWLVVLQQTVFSWSMRTGGFEVQPQHQGFDLKTVRCSWSLMKKKKRKWRQKQINQVTLKPVKVTAI